VSGTCSPTRSRAVAHLTDPVHYQWSSHKAYLGTVAMPWITTEFGLSLFGADPSRARAAYARFLSQDAAEPGGRARPDWEFAAEPKTLPFEEMSLPQDLAIASLHNHSTLTLEELASRICPAHRISPDRLRSPSRARDLPRFVWISSLRRLTFASRLSPNSRASCIGINPR
jgi:hypothetical protein